ncbi:MAG: nodulation protein NfeD [Odoribacter sp.]|nr:nodulation protein NfeD [Odoribacter sp.]
MLKKYLFLFVLLGLWSVSALAGQPTVVYKVEVKDEIGPGIWRMVKKSFDEAEKAGADCILIDMNTYGGLVVYADSLRSLILNSRRPVWVFIDNNAASAGALIAVACDRIYMREGANIGAATVVNQTGEAMPDKYQSYMRSMIRSTAQAHGRDTLVHGRDTVLRWKRDPQIAEAMVDERIHIPGVTDSGKVVTFTPHEALKYGFCNGIAEDVAEVLRQEGVGDYTLLSYTPTAVDRIIGFLIHPMVQGILIMMIIGGIYFELQTPGIGFPLAVAVTGAVLYFAPLYLEGFAASWELVVFVLGVILLLLEIFVIPGFGVAGVSGIVCMVGALVLASVDDFSFDFLGDFVGTILRSLFVVIAASLFSLGLCFWLGAKMLGSRRWAFALHAEHRPEDGFVGVDMTIRKEVDKEGYAVTDLRPVGKIRIDGELYDAVAEQGDYISKNTPVRVVKYQAGQLYVVRTGE